MYFFPLPTTGVYILQFQIRFVITFAYIKKSLTGVSPQLTQIVRTSNFKNENQIKYCSRILHDHFCNLYKRYIWSECVLY